MAKNIESRFGITVEINRDIPKEEYVELQRRLSAALTASNLDPRKVRIYIHHIRISASPEHFRVGPLSRRMEKLAIRLTINAKAQRKRLIVFMNHRLNVTYQDHIKVHCRDFRMEYELTGAYCESHTEFDDYVALSLEPDCPEGLKQMTMSITAFATQHFWKNHLLNNPNGTANTKLLFPLSQDIQLTF